MDESLIDLEDLEETSDRSYHDANIFIIDVSPEIFERDQSFDNTYFDLCLHVCGQIVSEKLKLNREDWMSLVFYNSTKKWDHDPENKHILTIFKLSEVNIEMMHILHQLLAGKPKKEDYCDPSSLNDLDAHLGNVLVQAYHSLESVKPKVNMRQVVLFTGRDNPCAYSNVERHNIREKVKIFKSSNVSLQVVGLGDDWKYESFYLDINVIASGIKAENSSRLKLDDLEFRMKYPSKYKISLKLIICDKVEIPIIVVPLSSEAKILKKVQLYKDTNEILDFYKAERIPNNFETESQDRAHDLSQISENMPKSVTCGDETINLQSEELRKIRASFSKGIKLICFKPVVLYLRYHIEPTKFVGISSLASEDETRFFATLLNRCEAKNVMAICSVASKSQMYLAQMIPYRKLNGFLLNKIPFLEEVSDLKEYAKMYVYDANHKDSLPIDKDRVKLMKKIIKKLRIHWEPCRYFDPDLDRQLWYIETLALDIEATNPPDDSTLPNREYMEDRLKDVTEQFEKMFQNSLEVSRKRESSTSEIFEGNKKSLKFDQQYVRDHIKNKNLNDLTVPILKSYAEALGLRTSGLKKQLIERIVAYSKNEDANIEY